MVGIDRNTSVELLPIEHHPSNMDANIYNARLKEVKKAFAIILHRIDMFGPEDITLEDKDTYKDYLEETRRLIEEACKVTFDLCSELDIADDVDGRRIEEINQLEAKSKQEFKDKSRAIKDKILELSASMPGINMGAQLVTMTLRTRT